MLCCFINQRARKLRSKQRSLLSRGTGKILRRMFMQRRPQISFLRMSSLQSGSTCESCHSYSLLICPRFSIRNLSISLKSKLLNLRRFSQMGLLRSQILESTSVSSGSTITCLTSSLLVLISSSAVSSARVRGETKRMSTLRFCWKQAEGRCVRCACSTPSLLREQSMSLTLWCRLLLRGSSREAVGMCTYLLNSDSAWRTISASVRQDSLWLNTTRRRKTVAVVGVKIRIANGVIMNQDYTTIILALVRVKAIDGFLNWGQLWRQWFVV